MAYGTRRSNAAFLSSINGSKSWIKKGNMTFTVSRDEIYEIFSDEMKH
jgi:hypothetical protein